MLQTLDNTSVATMLSLNNKQHRIVTLESKTLYKVSPTMVLLTFWEESAGHRADSTAGDPRIAQNLPEVKGRHSGRPSHQEFTR